MTGRLESPASFRYTRDHEGNALFRLTHVFIFAVSGKWVANKVTTALTRQPARTDLSFGLEYEPNFEKKCVGNFPKERLFAIVTGKKCK
jgi:hypothetical protein